MRKGRPQNVEKKPLLKLTFTQTRWSGSDHRLQIFGSSYKNANQSSSLVPIFGTTKGRMVLASSQLVETSE